MRLDESYTFLYYLNRGRDPFNYVIPNNHVLHTLLAWVSVAIGGMGPLALRIPAFLAGVLCIPLAYFVSRAFDRNAGPAAAVGMAVFPYMILYSTMARGYSLLVLLTLALLLAGKLYVDRPSPGGVILIALVAALGMLTMPTMVFVLAGVYPWLALALFIRERNGRALLRGFLIPCALWTALFTVLLYTPTVISSHGPQSIFSNRFVDSRGWNDFLTHLPGHVQMIFSDLSRDVPRAVEYGLVLLVLVGLFAAWRRRDWASVLLPFLVVLGSAAVLFAKHAIPFVRTWIYLVPFALLYADLGYTALVARLRPGLRWAPAGLILLAGVFYAGSLAARNAIAAYPDTGAFPEAAAVAQYLKPLMTGNEYIVVRDPANYTSFYYLCYDDAPPQDAAIDPATARRYFITQKGVQALSDLTDQPATLLYTYGNAVIYTTTGGPAPLFPAYVFDCRGTRK
jgi:4-amino-4-deoxy-L-arabinose transferase-like glycosyltransferase